MSFKNKIEMSKQGIEMIIIAGLSILIYVISSQVDILEKIVAFSRTHENYELDEFITVAIFLSITLLFIVVRRMRDFKETTLLMLQKNKNLEEAIAEIKQLKGIIPICASCKMIRDDEGFWHQVEVYVKRHSEAEFSHGLCPDCAQKLYPQNYKNKEEKE